MQNFAIKIFAVMAYLILLCIVTAVSAKKVMSNVQDVAELQKYGINELIKNCSICGRSHAALVEATSKRDTVNDTKKAFTVQVVTCTKVCTANIMDKDHIITSIDCHVKIKNCTVEKEFCKYRPDEILILITGDSKIRTIGPPVEKIYDCQETEGQNDMVIMRLKASITCNAFLVPSCLPSSNFSVPDKSMFSIAGWGKTGFQQGDSNKMKSNPDPNPIELLEAKVLALDVSNCGLDKQSETDHYCVIRAEENTPCFSIAGGPLLYEYNKVFYTLGVASSQNSSDCDVNAPVRYTRIDKCLEIIKKVTGLGPAQEVEV